MNLLGKIFVVLIFVMSLIFMTFVIAVYATHTNWKKEADTWKEKANAASTHNSKLRGELDKAQGEVTAIETSKGEALAKLVAEKDTLQDERDRLEKEYAALEKDRREAVAAMEASQTSLATLRKEVEALRANIDTAQNDRRKAFERVVSLTDQMHQAQNELAVLKSRNVQLSQQMADANQVLQKFNLEPIPAKYEGVPPQFLKGKILAVKGSGLVEVDLGTDDGLAKGHRLEVYRMTADQAKYLGRIEMIEVQPDKAVGKILPEFQKGAFEIGDQVASTLGK